ncbi:MAG TPA: hypothetical protein VG756_28465 [Pseudonocardiaceae bacterium]|jgi:hypothetical protein|nr:hypothetical protein [Pseudonocardiaceae bacterium]
MATWEDLAAYVRSEYRVVRETRDELRIEVGFEEDERTQIVILAHEVLDGREDWVQILSLCGRADQVNLAQLLTELGDTTVVTGAVIMGEHVALRHSLPLANLDINEFVDPVELLAGTADELEEKFGRGVDEY